MIELQMFGCLPSWLGVNYDAHMSVVSFNPFSHLIFVYFTEIYAFANRPWGFMSDEEVITSVRNGATLNKPRGCPQSIYALLTECWRTDADERPSPQRLRERLHDIDMEPLYEKFISYNDDFNEEAPPPEHDDLSASNAAATIIPVNNASPLPTLIAPIETAISATNDLEEQADQSYSYAADAIPANMTVVAHTVTPDASPPAKSPTLGQTSPSNDRSGTPITELMQTNDSDPENEELSIPAPITLPASRFLLLDQQSQIPLQSNSDYDFAAQTGVLPMAAPGEDEDGGDMYVNENQAFMPEEIGMVFIL
jgi:hypothetical protein